MTMVKDKCLRTCVKTKIKEEYSSKLQKLCVKGKATK